MLKPVTIVAIAVCLALLGCADQRYRYNVAHQSLSPKIKQLPQADRDEILRLVSEHCAVPIYCISWHSRDREVWVAAANSVSMDSSRNGLFELKKEDGHWWIVFGGLGLSTSLISCDDT